MNKESPYWMALAHLPRWHHLKLNTLIIKFYHERKLGIQDFFNLSESVWRSEYQLNEKEIDDLKKAKSEVANNAFLAETLLNEGYELIPIISSDYSKILKENLKVTYSPALLYIKGNKKILTEKSIAIVGSRDASKISLEFTDNVAMRASKEYKVVVSGFAKGVDKQALDSAVKYVGQSIIVLPQGIMTFGSGFKNYYKQIIAGDILVLSTFQPKAPWRPELAMARNPIIYGLADEIFVAESSDKGGTWSGVLDGLKKNRKIFVRQPNPNETNANHLLIQKGAVAVDFHGYPVQDIKPEESFQKPILVNEPYNAYKNQLLELLKKNQYTIKEIIIKLNLSITETDLKSYLANQKDIELINKRPIRYTYKNSNNQQKLFFD